MKTVQEAVFNAIDYMRRNTINMQTQKASIEDDVFKTYGFTSHNVCILIDYVADDLEKELPHQSIHNLSNVGDIIKEIESLVNDSYKSDNIKNITNFMAEIDETPKVMSKLIKGVIIQSTILDILNIEFELAREFEKALKTISILTHKVNKIIVLNKTEIFNTDALHIIEACTMKTEILIQEL